MGVSIFDHGTEIPISLINYVGHKFDAAQAYKPKDYVIYDNQIYRFRANKAAGAWDATKVDSDPKYILDLIAKAGGGSIVQVHTDEETLIGTEVTLTGTTQTESDVFDENGDAVFTGIIDQGIISIYATDGEKEKTVTINISGFSLYKVTIILPSPQTGITLQDWLTAGSTTEHPINPSSYSTFADVEADEEVVRQLMTVHNAVDYLATSDGTDELIGQVINSDICAKWINLRDYALDTLSANADIKALMDVSDNTLRPQVPVMTSNTSPYGVASASSSYGSGYEAYKVFDGDDTSHWNTPSNVATDSWVQYRFICPIKVTRAKIGFDYGGDGKLKGKNFKIQASNDGSTFADLTEVITAPNEDKVLTVDFTKNIDEYSYYRLFVVDSYGTTISVETLQFYGSDNVVVNPLVPAMTSNTTPSGVASVKDSMNVNFPAYYAFDGDDTTCWVAGSESSWIQYDFGHSVIVKHTKIYNNQSQRTTPWNGVLKASNDGADFTTIKSGIVMSSAGWLNIDVDNDTAYRYYRLEVVGTASSYAQPQINTLQFYSVTNNHSKYGYGEWALVGQVPKMTSNTAPYGVASASTTNATGFEAYRAFDGIQGTPNTNRWSSDGGDANKWLQYKFIEAKKIAKVIVYPYRDMDTTIVVKGSNDGSTFTDLATLTFTADGSGGQDYSKAYPIDIPEDKQASYMYYRLAFTVPSGRSAVVGELQFYAWQPKGNVPVMTSNTAPYGEASASNVWSPSTTGLGAFSAFNPDSNYGGYYGWAPYINGSNEYVSYKAVNPFILRKVFIRVCQANDIGPSAEAAVDEKIQGSNDGVTWVDLGTITLPAVPKRSSTSVPPEVKMVEAEVNNSTPYMYHRVLCETTGGLYAHNGSGRLRSQYIEFYGRELSVSVPTMTSNTAPYGEAIYSSELGNFKAWNMFDGVEHAESINTYLAWHAGSRTDEWCGFDFKKPVVVKMMAILPSYQYGVSGDVKRVKSYKYQGSNDGNVWEDLTDTLVTNQSTQNEWYYTLLNNNDAYRYYRVFVFDNWGSNYYIAVSEAKIFGLDYSEREFAEGSTMKYIYDHGVELEELTEVTTGSGSLVTRETDHIKIYVPASAQRIAAIYKNMNLSDYDIAKVKYGKEYLNGVYLSVFSQIPNYAQTGGVAHSGTGQVLNSVFNSLDISSLNGTYYIANQAANNSGAAISYTDIDEWWLE